METVKSRGTKLYDKYMYTSKEKVEILKKAKKRLSEIHKEWGLVRNIALCFLIREIVHDRMNGYYLTTWTIQEIFEMEVVRPKDLSKVTSGFGYWWNFDSKGYYVRHCALNKLINHFENKK